MTTVPAGWSKIEARSVVGYCIADGQAPRPHNEPVSAPSQGSQVHAATSAASTLPGVCSRSSTVMRALYQSRQVRGHKALRHVAFRALDGPAPFGIRIEEVPPAALHIILALSVSAGSGSPRSIEIVPARSPQEALPRGCRESSGRVSGARLMRQKLPVHERDGSASLIIPMLLTRSPIAVGPTSRTPTTISARLPVNRLVSRSSTTIHQM
jgi:hypothetical protein